MKPVDLNLLCFENSMYRNLHGNEKHIKTIHWFQKRYTQNQTVLSEVIQLNSDDDFTIFFYFIFFVS